MTPALAVADTAKADAALAVMRESDGFGAGARVTRLEQLAGGWSRHSYALTVCDPDSGERQFIVRVRPRTPILDNDLGQEFRTYRLLRGEPIPTPDVHGMDPSPDTPFGGPFFIMDRLPGHDLNVWRKKDRAALAADWAGPRRIAKDLVRSLAAIHAIPAERLRGAVSSRDYTQTLDRWQSVQSEMALVRDPIVEEAYRWARENEPAPVARCLVHGDYRIGNCLVQDGRITGVLDWELTAVGDPRFDLGYMSLDYHAGRFVHPGSNLFNAVADTDWFFHRYETLTGHPVDREAVRTFAVVGGLMLIAILHTGMRVYARGETDDIRMAWSRFAIPGLRQDLVKLMRWARTRPGSSQGAVRGERRWP